ncbi:hypothetical protein SAMN05216326_1326 [Nitrosomonas marina]|uniref:Uncharacterized protein n=1 Tax=Nitrosomonas marina TaxID=917 RepID=A0A1I0F2K0_9PROT|nr:hypothetical protein [Nitrosomonas marina]SET51426.1 hypothetical protein SAMN05216326_1326 [Nitrosomonas marina]
MKHTIQNISRRPLTIICNSGKAIHMAPDYCCEVNETDLKVNPMIKKMLDKKLIRCTDSKTETRLSSKVSAKSAFVEKKAKETAKE